jgi:hypothetical protein
MYTKKLFLCFLICLIWVFLKRLELSDIVTEMIRFPIFFGVQCMSVPLLYGVHSVNGHQFLFLINN